MYELAGYEERKKFRWTCDDCWCNYPTTSLPHRFSIDNIKERKKTTKMFATAFHLWFYLYLILSFFFSFSLSITAREARLNRDCGRNNKCQNGSVIFMRWKIFSAHSIRTLISHKWNTQTNHLLFEIILRPVHIEALKKENHNGKLLFGPLKLCVLLKIVADDWTAKISSGTV